MFLHFLIWSSDLKFKHWWIGILHIQSLKEINQSLPNESIYALLELMLFSFVSNLISNRVRIIVWNSLRNKHAERSEAFSSLQTKVFLKNWEAFLLFCDVILSISNTFFDNSLRWIKCGYHLNIIRKNILWVN